MARRCWCSVDGRSVGCFRWIATRTAAARYCITRRWPGGGWGSETGVVPIEESRINLKRVGSALADAWPSDLENGPLC